MDCELQFLITLVISEMKTTALIFFLWIAMTVHAQNIQPPQSAVKVDPGKCLGRWYDIASYPTGIRHDCRCTTLDFEPVPDREFLRITSRCVKFRNGKSRLSVARGKAFAVRRSDNTRFKVHFISPFLRNCQIIGLADDYSWAIIGHPNQKCVWILYREAYMPTDSYNNALRVIQENGYDLKRIQKTPQNCDNPE